jgi:hypothetical protein
MRTRILSSLSLLLLQSFAVLPVYAVTFPDVSFTQQYRAQIEALADKGIVKGNPDGSFNPSKSINRAELLTLLYRATNKTPEMPTKACFKDVGTTSWFSAVVCDASKNGYVGGYPDGNFRPEKEVNRVEALKMIHTVFGFSLDPKASTKKVSAYTDVSLTAWYAPYMANAFLHGVLPIAGHDGAKYMPEKALQRDEAAAYVFNALGLTIGETAGSSSAASVAQASARSTMTAQSAASEGIRSLDVDYPFADDGKFNGKTSKVYKFNLQKPVTTVIAVSVSAEATVQCRLYKLEKTTSFALEYYVGHIVDNSCSMRVSLGNGDYQMEVTPKDASVPYELTTKIVTGDGNDGFREASMLVKGTPKTGYLEEDDYAEWYTFKLTKTEKLTVEVTGKENTRCYVYAMGDVDLYGFSGPVCGEQYEYPAGTYYVGVMRLDGRVSKQSFTIRTF